MRKKRHLLFLIESDIKAIALMSRLEGVQLDFDVYLADHSALIFECMGIDLDYCTDELYSTYFSLVGKGRTIDLKNGRTALNQLTLQIYNYLFKYRELCVVLEKELLFV